MNLIEMITNFFDKEKQEIRLNGEGVETKREPNSRFTYRIVRDWDEVGTTNYFSAVDSFGLPLSFPESDVKICGETSEIVENMVLENYPLATQDEIEREWI